MVEIVSLGSGDIDWQVATLVEFGQRGIELPLALCRRDEADYTDKDTVEALVRAVARRRDVAGGLMVHDDKAFGVSATVPDISVLTTAGGDMLGGSWVDYRAVPGLDRRVHVSIVRRLIGATRCSLTFGIIPEADTTASGVRDPAVMRRLGTLTSIKIGYGGTDHGLLTAGPQAVYINARALPRKSAAASRKS